METGIYLETKAVSSGNFVFDQFQKATGFRHAYLVYRKADGSTEVIRGGLGRHVTVETGKSMEDSADGYDAGEEPGSRPSQKLDIPPEQWEQSWKTMKGRAEEMRDLEIPYANDVLEGDVDKTSNTIVRGALDSIKYPAEKALPKGEKMDDVPGFEDDHKELVEEIKVIKADREADREAARNSRSPLEGEIGGTPAETPTKPTPDSGDEQSGVTPDATNTPGAKAFMAEVMKDDDPIDSILQKRPETWTSDEAKQVMYTRSGLPDGDPRVAEIMKLEDAHYKQAYGDGPMAVDDTGKPVDVEPAPAIPSKPVAARDADGTPMKESVARAAKKMVQLAAKDAEKDGPGVVVDKGAHAPVVKQLQGGLNMMSKFAKTPVAGGAESRLKLDGVMGPKTRHSMRDTLSKDGFGRFDEALSLGQFRDFAERSRAGGSGINLGKEIEGSFANLFRAPKLGGPKIESSVLQETLNRFGSERPNYTPLKVDGDIGPKTSDTFDLFNKSLGPDKLTGGLGKMFGFFG